MLLEKELLRRLRELNLRNGELQQAKAAGAQKEKVTDCVGFVDVFTILGCQELKTLQLESVTRERFDEVQDKYDAKCRELIRKDKLIEELQDKVRLLKQQSSQAKTRLTELEGQTQMDAVTLRQLRYQSQISHFSGLLSVCMLVMTCKSDSKRFKVCLETRNITHRAFSCSGLRGQLSSLREAHDKSEHTRLQLDRDLQAQILEVILPLAHALFSNVDIE